ncbi:hypothetical protein H4N49_31425 [Streptomyces sp. DHE17-7]|nr:hypothetical protein [Streptomyces sp. DHE17-7]
MCVVFRSRTDVIGAQRAFSNTLSCVVVTGVVCVLSTRCVMLTLSWQITLLAWFLRPVF